MAGKRSSAIKRRLRSVKNRMHGEHRQVTLYFLRIILAVVVMITLFTPRRSLSLLLFIATIILGFVDYRRYKRLENHTQFESILNALSDKLLIILASIALFVQGMLPIWAAAIFILKDVGFILGGMYALARNKYTVFQQRTISKITLFLQVVAIIAILFDKLDTILLIAAAVMTVLNLIVIVFKPEFSLAKKHPIFDEFAFTKMVKIADLVTLSNVLVGLLVIALAISGNTILAAILLILAVFLDFFDGKIARWSKTSNEFGKQLDSLADTVSFGVAPTVIGFTLIQSKLALIAFSIFLFCGILRLAKFNIMDAKGYYVGMPITMNGILIPIAIFAGMPAMYFPYLYLFLGALMVAPIRMKKSI